MNPDKFENAKMFSWMRDRFLKMQQHHFRADVVAMNHSTTNITRTNDLRDRLIFCTSSNCFFSVYTCGRAKAITCGRTKKFLKP